MNSFIKFKKVRIPVYLVLIEMVKVKPFDTIPPDIHNMVVGGRSESMTGDNALKKNTFIFRT